MSVTVMVLDSGPTGLRYRTVLFWTFVPHNIMERLLMPGLSRLGGVALSAETGEHRCNFEVRLN